NPVVGLTRARQLLADVERPIIPVRVLHHDEPEEIVVHRMRFVAGNRAPLRLAARLEAAGYFRAGFRIDDWRIDPTSCHHLRFGQTVRSVRTLALDDRRIESTSRRIGNEAILQSIERVALVQRSVVKRRILAGWNEALRADMRRLRHAERLKG